MKLVSIFLTKVTRRSRISPFYLAQYDPGNPVPSHFTQVVWKGTTELGCAHALCNNLIPGAGQAHFYVCEYSPSGNVIGQFGYVTTAYF